MNRALSGWLQGLLWVTSALWAVGTIAEVAELNAMNTAWGSRWYINAHAWLDANETTDGFVALAIFGWIPAFVLLIVWSFKAHRATDLLQPERRSWSSGWTIGGWFIPLAQFVIPGQVLIEVEKISSADRANGQVSAHWRNNRAWFGGWVWWWWVAWILVSVWNVSTFLVRCWSCWTHRKLAGPVKPSGSVQPS